MCKCRGRVCPDCKCCSGGSGLVMVDYCRLVGMLVTLAGWVTIIVAWVKGPSSPFQSNTETSTREIVITAFNLTNSTQDAVPFLGSMVSAPAYILLMTIFIFLKPRQTLIYIAFVLLLYTLSSLNIFFCGGIFGSLFLVEGRPDWLVLAFFGSIIVAGCSLLVGATFLTKRASRSKKSYAVIDEETKITKA